MVHDPPAVCLAPEDVGDTMTQLHRLAIWTGMARTVLDPCGVAEVTEVNDM
jgi:hypothetical protein